MVCLASLVSRSAFMGRSLQGVLRKVFCLWFSFPHPLWAPQVSSAEVLLAPKLIPSWKQTSQNQVDTWPLPQSGRWSLSLMVLTKAKFRQSLCAYREAVCRGNNNQGHLLCAVGMFFSSSFSQRKSSICNATAQHWQEHFSFHVLLLHAVALKCQIVIRSLLFWLGYPSVTVWLTLLLLSMC